MGKKLTLKKKIGVTAKAKVKEEPVKKEIPKKQEARIIDTPPKTVGKKSTGRSAGRPAGRKYKVSTAFQSGLEDNFTKLEAELHEYRVHLNNFLGKGTKSAAKDARKALQNITNLCKGARPTIQEAKKNMEIVESS